LQKFNKCCKTFSNNSLVSGLFPIFFWMLYQQVPKKNLKKVEKSTRNFQKTAFSWEKTAGIL